jgi:hypothetical protein
VYIYLLLPESWEMARVFLFEMSGQLYYNVKEKRKITNSGGRKGNG